jgi:penicillin amidase
MSRFQRSLRLLLGIIVLLVVVVAGSGLYYFRVYLPQSVAPRSFPQVEGEIQLPVKQTVEIYRDKMGIPHIYASTMYDLFFAQGYVHAQDRFWQMDFWRHIGTGRLSEMFGKSQLETDKFLRTLGWSQLAEQEYAMLDEDSRAILQAYADGVNAYLATHRGEALSLEYAVLKLLNAGYQIEPWRPVHSLVWAKVMAWDLRGNMGSEIQRAILARTLTPAQIDELMPPYPKDHPVIVPKIGEGVFQAPPAQTLFSLFQQMPFESLAARFEALDGVTGGGARGLGSNSWVVAGSRTATGKPILANDPHLGIQMPSIWYQIALHCRPKSETCPMEVGGFSFAGVPGVVIGHNDRIAWGFTNVGPDVIDLYIEKVNPENPNQYEVNGQWVDFETRKEVIQVAGGDPVEITVRLTRHGPVISDTYGPLKDQVDPKDKEAKPFREQAGIELPPHYVIAMRWTALQPLRVFDAIWGFNRAQNWEEFHQAARLFAVPAQNLVYADVDGNIGYQMPGLIPIRKNGDGRYPVPGWTDEYEWVGYIPFEELPYLFNPASGYIVTANNQVNPWDYPYLITADWDYGFRAKRIVDLIEQAPSKVDLAYIQKMHGDNYDAGAAAVVPVLLSIPLNDAHLEEVRSILNGWDYQADMNSAPAALYEVFWSRLLAKTFRDELPKRYWPEGGDQWFEVMRHLVDQPQSPWWDDRSTPEKIETRDEIFRSAFQEAVTEIEKRLGKDPKRWRWGDLHTATFRNATLGKSGISLIENLFNRGPFPTAGGSSIVNATAWDTNEGYEVLWLPSMRMIVDLSDLNQSLTVHTTGQSGHAYHPHYADMIELWRNIQYYPMWWNEESVRQNAEARLVIRP